MPDILKGPNERAAQLRSALPATYRSQVLLTPSMNLMTAHDGSYHKGMSRSGNEKLRRFLVGYYTPLRQLANAALLTKETSNRTADRQILTTVNCLRCLLQTVSFKGKSYVTRVRSGFELW